MTDDKEVFTTSRKNLVVVRKEQIGEHRHSPVYRSAEVMRVLLLLPSNSIAWTPLSPLSLFVQRPSPDSWLHPKTGKRNLAG
jgi:hypothetical protein